MMRIFKIIFLLCLISSAVYSQRIVIPLRSAEIKAGTDVIWSLNIKEGFNDTTIDIARKIYTPTVNFNINIPVCRSFYMGAFYNTNKMFGIKGTFKDDNIFYINNYKDPATDALGNPRLLLKWNIEMEMYGISMMFKNVNISKNYYALEIFKVKSSLSYSLPVNYDDRFPVKETDSVYFIDNTTSRLQKDLPGFLENYPKKNNQKPPKHTEHLRYRLQSRKIVSCFAKNLFLYGRKFQIYF